MLNRGISRSKRFDPPDFLAALVGDNSKQCVSNMNKIKKLLNSPIFADNVPITISVVSYVPVDFVLTDPLRSADQPDHSICL